MIQGTPDEPLSLVSYRRRHLSNACFADAALSRVMRLPTAAVLGYRLMAKNIVRFTAVRTVTKPATVRFKTKSGKTVSFKAVKTVRKRQVVKFRAKK